MFWVRLGEGCKGGGGRRVVLGGEAKDVLDRFGVVALLQLMELRAVLVMQPPQLLLVLSLHVHLRVS